MFLEILVSTSVDCIYFRGCSMVVLISLCFLLWWEDIKERERGCCWTQNETNETNKQGRVNNALKKKSKSMEYGGKIRRVYLAKTLLFSNSAFMNHGWVMWATGWIIGYVKPHSSQFTGCEDQNRHWGGLQDGIARRRRRRTHSKEFQGRERYGRDIENKGMP